MRKQFAVLLAAASAFCSFAAPKPDAQAQAFLKELEKKAPIYRPRSGKTAFFGRAQLKYDLSRTDYAHAWFDRPLMQDSSFSRKAKEAGDEKSFINLETWKKMVAVADYYKLTGYSFFPQSKRREHLYERAKMPGLERQILVELVNFKNTDAIMKTAATALQSPQSYRIDGKVVLTSYPGNADGKLWKNFGDKLRAQHGEKFLLMPMYVCPRKLMGKEVLTLEDTKVLMENIRAFLRCVDGFYNNEPPRDSLRRYDYDFDSEVMLPIIRAILAEPEFQHKYLAWGTKVGHENYYEKGSYTFDCAGTDLLRGSVGSAVLAQADIVNLVEWDEENENTHFRPTLLNSFSTGRLIRYYSETANGGKTTVVPGDDVSIPNLILSYRRILVAGQTLELELINVPDGSAKVPEYSVELALNDLSGKTVKSFTGKLDAAKLSELRFNVPVAEILNHHVLVPVLTVNGQKFDRGFAPIELRALWNYDYHWVKQPLRDLAPVKNAVIEIDRNINLNGMILVRGKIESDTPLRSVEVLCGSDQVYMAGSDPKLVETPDRVVISLLMLSRPRTKLPWRGHVKLVNAANPNFATDADIARNRPGKDGWEFNRGAIPNNFNGMVLRCGFDRASVKDAYFDVDLYLENKEDKIVVFKGQIPVADVIAKRLWAVTTTAESALVLHHTGTPVTLPEPVNQKSVEFAFLTAPQNQQAVYSIEAVDANYRTFRSQPVTIFRPSGTTVAYSVFDQLQNKPVTVSADTNLVNKTAFEISPLHGTAVVTTFGNELSGLMGAFSPIVNQLRGLGENCYGNWTIERLRKNGLSVPSAPATVQEEDGSYSWKFTGKENVAFPCATIYPFAGFRLTLKVMPDGSSQRYTILAAGNAGFRLWVNKGYAVAGIYLANPPKSGNVGVAGPKLLPNQWNTVIVDYDMKNLTVTVNGKSKSKPCCGYQLFPRSLTIGMDKLDAGFSGKIGALTLEPR